ncbi:hypothetical protein NS228_28460 [Methylobacterium indicum]|uniref:hypothetical protein n=1 Tax=Methylobacterium indicum TaxID=1775910 RepID=UPI0007341F95|nr:hypothetical protein [Methylobacterium indicum]KTS16509.1 hypothetical protein NS229_27250 [Methylobacterium indicum]KTS19273.1 hypothetical protein NS228_28460 [Methylobacterium indicum]KTS42741.1 hypothetical protein NS230_27890 [Methylobacterium indicum]
MTIHQRPVAPADAVRLDASHLAMPSPIQAALARLASTGAALAAVAERYPDRDHPEHDAAERADDWAFQAVFAAPIETRGDAEALLGFMLQSVDKDPAADGLAAVTHLLARALAGEFQTHTTPTTRREG